jgi:hypothetical protein
MKIKGRLLGVLLYILASAIVVAVIVIVGLFVHDIIKSRHGLVHLLCETDYQVLLDSCRELSDRVAQGQLKSGSYWVRIRNQPNAKQFNFPQIIFDIEPAFIHIDTEGWVMIEMTGIPFSGIVAYPGDSKVGSEIGDVELIPGLWYYCEDYRDEYPDLMKKIDALIKIGQIRQRQRDSERNNKEQQNSSTSKAAEFYEKL